MLQLLTAFLTAFVYLIALFYGINDIDAVFNTNVNYFPVAEIYLQATGSTAGAVGLISLLFLATFPTLDCPVNATVAMAVMVSCLGCVYVGSTTAFQALISSFIVLSTLSYAGAIVPHILSRRRSVVLGPFAMPHKIGYVVNILAVLYIAVTVVFFCFPFTLPVTVQNMNYTSVITVGLMTLVGIWWLFQGMRTYKGPTYSREAAERLAMGKQESSAEMSAMDGM